MINHESGFSPLESVQKAVYSAAEKARQLTFPMRLELAQRTGSIRFLTGLEIAGDPSSHIIFLSPEERLQQLSHGIVSDSTIS